MFLETVDKKISVIGEFTDEKLCMLYLKNTFSFIYIKDFFY